MNNKQLADPRAKAPQHSNSGKKGYHPPPSEKGKRPGPPPARNPQKKP